MSKAEKGRLYESEVPKGLRFDSWEEDEESKNKKKKKKKTGGGRSFVLDKMKKDGRGEYKEV